MILIFYTEIKISYGILKVIKSSLIEITRIVMSHEQAQTKYFIQPSCLNTCIAMMDLSSQTKKNILVNDTAIYK